MSQLFTERLETAPTLRAENTLHIPNKLTVRFGKYSLSYEGAKIWNHLPNDIRKAKQSTYLRLRISSKPGKNVTVLYVSEPKQLTSVNLYLMF
jgi:hypothetical protein